MCQRLEKYWCVKYFFSFLFLIYINVTENTMRLTYGFMLFVIFIVQQCQKYETLMNIMVHDLFFSQIVKMEMNGSYF